MTTPLGTISTMIALLIAACASLQENILDNDSYKHVKGEEYKEYFYANANQFSRDTDYEYLVIDRGKNWALPGQNKEEIAPYRNPEFIDPHDSIEYNQRVPTAYDDPDFTSARRRYIQRQQKKLPHDIMITEDATALLKKNHSDEETFLSEVKGQISKEDSGIRSSRVANLMVAAYRENIFGESSACPTFLYQPDSQGNFLEVFVKDVWGNTTSFLYHLKDKRFLETSECVSGSSPKIAQLQK